MSVKPEDVARIAHLAHLGLTPDERERLTVDLNRILEHVDALRTLELTQVPDLMPQLGASLASTRTDEADVPDGLAVEPDDFAPEMTDGFFVVPPPPGLDQDPVA